MATVIVTLALVAAAVFFFWKEKPPQALQALVGVKAADLTKIEIVSGGKSLILENAGSWRLSSPIQDEAETSSAEEFADSLLSLSIGSAVSRDAASFSDYGLDEAHAARLRVYAKKSAAPILDVWFGKSALGSSCYWRRDREATVYLAEGLRPYLLNRPVDDWRSRALMPFSLDELQALHMEKPRAFSVTKSSGSWAAPGLSADKASELVLAVSALRFTSFAADAPDKKTGFNKPSFVVSASGKGMSEKILLGKEDGPSRWAKVEGRKTLGLISKSAADSLLKLLKP